jgi:hypothetical protein
MLWEILAWAGVILLSAFRIAIVVGLVATVFMIIRALRTAGSPVRHAGVPGRR